MKGCGKAALWGEKRVVEMVDAKVVCLVGMTDDTWAASWGALVMWSVDSTAVKMAVSTVGSLDDL